MGRHKDEHPTQRALWNRAYRERRSPETVERAKLRMQLRGHSMTLEQYAALRVAQSDRCSACREPLLFDQPYKVHIDHDPKCCSRDEYSQIQTCGKCVRGLLCVVCNHAIGFLERYPQRLEMWTGYLRRTSK